MEVETVHEVEQLQALVRDAKARRLKVSIAGSRHSQGGHTYTAGGVVLDMRGFNRILAIDTDGADHHRRERRDLGRGAARHRARGAWRSR